MPSLQISKEPGMKQIKSIEIMHNLEIMHVKDLLPDYRQNYVKVLWRSPKYEKSSTTSSKLLDSSVLTIFQHKYLSVILGTPLGFYRNHRRLIICRKSDKLHNLDNSGQNSYSDWSDWVISSNIVQTIQWNNTGWDWISWKNQFSSWQASRQVVRRRSRQVVRQSGGQVDIHVDCR